MVVAKNGHIIRVEDIATVTRSQKTPESEVAIIDGEPGVIVAARMEPTLRVDQWTARAKATIESFERDLPSNVNVTILFDQQGYTTTRLVDLGESLLIGFTLILIVLFITLGVRAAILVAIALPLTCMLTLSLMKMTAIPINQMSVTGLIVALGIMVDNAVVMVDTIQSYRLKDRLGRGDNKGHLAFMGSAVRLNAHHHSRLCSNLPDARRHR
ncbi:cobalt-zinc-cadmium resistance protein CzcA [Vibrio variabilis]|uniref:Cobalt-zinc-cadmium resistance protein CzcA n=1 Tax=Vibrio variabilis TaxID=990271 RepID=A0ABQ0JE10_9VIBR|nr:cobalt-zinc-cadmium resistance protein CzcA [Vibrio variabilis]